MTFIKKAFLDYAEKKKMDLLVTLVEGLTLLDKPYQHIITILYPGIIYEESLFKPRFPNIPSI